MLSAGCVFFCRRLLLLLCRGGITPALHEQVDLRHEVRIGDKRHQPVIRLGVLDGRKEDIRPGILAELRKIFFLDAKTFQFLALSQQTVHAGFADQLFIIFGKGI